MAIIMILCCSQLLCFSMSLGWVLSVKGDPPNRVEGVADRQARPPGSSIHHTHLEYRYVFIICYLTLLGFGGDGPP